MKPPIDQHFPFTVVCKAAGVNYETMKRWALRGHLVMRDEDRETMGRGGHRQVSYYFAAQALVMGALTRQGVPLKDASQAATEFAYTGDDERGPGHLYTGAATLVAYNADSPTKHNVLRVSKTDSFLDVMNRTRPNGEGHAGVFVNVQLLLLEAAPILGMDDKWILETLE